MPGCVRRSWSRTRGRISRPGIRAAGGALRRCGRLLDLRAAFGAELRAPGVRAALGAAGSRGLDHRRAAFGTELGAGWGQGAVLGAARHRRARPLRRLGRLFDRAAQTEDVGDPLSDAGGLLGLRLGDLSRARAVILAEAALLVEVGQTEDLTAGGAFAEVLLHLAPSLVELRRRQGDDVAQVFTRHAIGHGAAEEGDPAQQIAGGLPADIFGDRAGDIGLAAILPIALVAIENGVGADPVVTHIVAGHAAGC